MNIDQESQAAFEKFKQGIQLINDAFADAGGWLLEDMEFSESFDSKQPYEEKNYYIYRANNLFGLKIMQMVSAGHLHPFYVDLYYTFLVGLIKQYEDKEHKQFNKGIVYANLGIAQIDQGKFDQGIANLLTAEWEDRDIANPQNFILNSGLWGQFEPKIVDYLISYNIRPNVSLGFTVDTTLIESLIKSLKEQDRIFLQGTILSLLDNISQHKIQPNSFTYARLYSGLKDLCLLTEALLRQQQNGKFQSTKDLYNLLKNALGQNQIQYHQPTLINSWKADNLKEFLNHLEKILNIAQTPELRMAHCIHLIRNFTGHHFDIQEYIVSASGKSFGDYYEIALENVISTLLYFKHINAI